MLNVKPILAGLIIGATLGAEPLITCTPSTLRGVPGQPLQLEVSATTDRASPIKLLIPHTDILHLHSVEKIPIQRTEEGRYIQKRIIIWQGTEAGSLTLTNLTVSIQPLGGKCPDIEITIDAVEPAKLPKKTEPAE